MLGVELEFRKSWGVELGWSELSPIPLRLFENGEAK